LEAQVPTQESSLAEANDRQWHLLELGLVCLISFGPALLTCAQYLTTGRFPSNSGGGTWRWLYSILHQLSGLAVLAYVLRRRSKTFADIGWRWSAKELVRVPLLWISAVIAYTISRLLLRLMLNGFHFTEAHHPDVGAYLFGGAAFVMSAMAVILNGFFEEMTVRAYVMTELKELTGNLKLAVTGSVVLQCGYHLYQGVPSALSYAAPFLIFSLYYAKTNRIVALVLTHIVMDLIGLSYYTATRGHNVH
jgi:membrane protease YdiL (CAAX protease family)